MLENRMMVDSEWDETEYRASRHQTMQQRKREVYEEQEERKWEAARWQHYMK